MVSSRYLEPFPPSDDQMFKQHSHITTISQKVLQVTYGKDSGLPVSVQKFTRAIVSENIERKKNGGICIKGSMHF